MRFYQALDGTIMDLDHVIAVAPAHVDRPWSSTEQFIKIHCAFGTSIFLSAPNAEEIEKVRNHLLNAWCPGKTR